MKDWGEVSEIYEEIHKKALLKELQNESEAQTRFDIIDRVIREILQWEFGQISVEEYTSTDLKSGYIDYLLICGDKRIIIEAKKIGSAFPSPTKKKNLKVNGKILGVGEIQKAIDQAEDYARNKDADVVIVTNGACWCFFSTKYKDRDNLYAHLLFPFEDVNDAELLFNIFEVHNVENGSIEALNVESKVVLNNRLINVLDNSDYRLDRNNIADYIMKGIDSAIMADSLNNESVLNECYVDNDNRTRFDKTLQIHLTQYKPSIIDPAKKIRRDKKNDEITDLLKLSKPSSSTPVTLVIGAVGSGKTTYLKHFELIKSKEILGSQKAHWIYIDYEQMGIDGNPREFLYKSLNEYLLLDKPNNSTDFDNVIYPAYEKEIEALKRGPYALLAKNKEKFEEKILEIIDKDYRDVEPYVEKVYNYLSNKQLCVIVIDNVDLYEDEILETKVFSEAIAISKSMKCVVFISLRDSTFIKHKDSSIFNAYELKKFWVNPPSFKNVLSKRLNYAAKVLEHESATVELNTGSKIFIQDLGMFFKIVQKSVLNEINVNLLEYLSDRNIRKGISLINNFLISGHIQADKAIRNYLEGDASFIFPYHEVFKGSVLGAWKYYKEERSEVLNIFESRLGSKKQQLIILYFLKFLHLNARIDNSEIELIEIVKFLSKFGVTRDTCIQLVEKLNTHNLIHTNEKHFENPKYFITLCGGYYITNLFKSFVYVETILYDVNIDDSKYFNELREVTHLIEEEKDWIEKMKLRKIRIEIFTNYLQNIEDELNREINLGELQLIDTMRTKILEDIDKAIQKMEFHQGQS